MKIGRYCQINGIKEVKDLDIGMDFRRPEFRREVFLRFYEFHLKYSAHAGAIYYIFPFIFEKHKMTEEQKLWFTFINGCSQNVVTTYLIWRKFPDIENVNIDELSKYFRENYTRFGWDTDRRYVKNQFEDVVKMYIGLLGGQSQIQLFTPFLNSDNKYKNFDNLWSFIIDKFYLFGRLATFSYLEYLRLAGLYIDCSSLFLDDISGSKSHRNGLCKVLGRDDLDWYKNDVKYTDEILNWLKEEGALLLQEALGRFPHKDISYFTLETTLCCYKSWHRPNRRYPNVYNDMFYNRIKVAENNWNDKRPFVLFWDARKEALPKRLRLESNPKDYGVAPTKQNHYLNTGQVIMMDGDWECFENHYNNFIS